MMEMLILKHSQMRKFVSELDQSLETLKDTCLLSIYKALYGLGLSGNAFGQILQEFLLNLSFVPFLAEPSINMRKFPTADQYEYT